MRVLLSLNINKEPLLRNAQGKLLRNTMLHDFTNNIVEEHIEAAFLQIDSRIFMANEKIKKI